MYGISWRIMQLYMRTLNLFLFSLIPWAPPEASNNSKNFCILSSNHPRVSYLLLMCTIARNDLTYSEQKTEQDRWCLTHALFCTKAQLTAVSHKGQQRREKARFAMERGGKHQATKESDQAPGQGSFNTSQEQFQVFEGPALLLLRCQPCLWFL